MKKKKTQLDNLMKDATDALNICLEYGNTIIGNDSADQDIAFMKIYEIYKHLNEALEIYYSIISKKNQIAYETLSLNRFFKLLTQQAKYTLVNNLPEENNEV